MIDALLHLLLTDIKTPSFKSDAAEFGKDWIAGCVQEQPVVQGAATLCKKTFT